MREDCTLEEYQALRDACARVEAGESLRLILAVNFPWQDQASKREIITNLESILMEKGARGVHSIPSKRFFNLVHLVRVKQKFMAQRDATKNARSR